jgi:phosphoribosylformylglycinamidine synthase
MELHAKRIPRLMENKDRDDLVLFSESNSRFLVEISSNSKQDFERLAKNIACAEIGSVTEKPELRIFRVNGEVAVKAPINSLRERWKSTFDGRKNP